MATGLFLELRDDHRITGTGRSSWHLYDKIDEILGTRVSSDPPIVIDSSLIESTVITDFHGEV